MKYRQPRWLPASTQVHHKCEDVPFTYSSPTIVNWKLIKVIRLLWVYSLEIYNNIFVVVVVGSFVYQSAIFINAFSLVFMWYMQNASVALQNQDFQMTSSASGSPLPISGTDPVPHGVHQTISAGGPNTVLRVIVESLLYPVSLEILHQIFQRFGKVLKIVTFNKNNSFQVSEVNGKFPSDRMRKTNM